MAHTINSDVRRDKLKTDQNRFTKVCWGSKEIKNLGPSFNPTVTTCLTCADELQWQNQVLNQINYIYAKLLFHVFLFYFSIISTLQRYFILGFVSVSPEYKRKIKRSTGVQRDIVLSIGYFKNIKRSIYFLIYFILYIYFVPTSSSSVREKNKHRLS